MPCHHIKIGDTTAIVCTRERRKYCAECGRVATKLCDFPLSGEKKSKTCDRPMCDAHAVSQSEGVDYCLAHDRVAKQQTKSTQKSLFEV